MFEFSAHVDKEYKLNTMLIPNIDDIRLDVTFIVDPQMANKIKSNYMKAQRKVIKLNGFRKGKVPINLIENKMGGIQAVYASSFITYANIKVIEHSPRKIIHTYNMNAEEQNDGSWIVTFIVLVESLIDIKEIENLKFNFDIPIFDLDNYVNDRIMNFSHVNPYLRMKEDNNGNFLPAEEGDMVEVSIEVFIDKEFKYGSHESIDIRLIPKEITLYSLYEKLLGSMSCDSFVITINNPEEIPGSFQKDFKGKSKFEMKVIVKHVYQCIEPEIDDDLAITAGYNTLDEWKANLYNSAENVSKSYNEQLKRSLILDYIMSNIRYPDLPNAWAESHVRDILKSKKYRDITQNEKLKMGETLRQDLKRLAKQYTLLKQIGEFFNIEWDEEDQNKSIYDRNEQRYAEKVLAYLVNERAKFTYVDTKRTQNTREDRTD